jgi:diguanylate cyclase (GGDEF)-like protein
MNDELDKRASVFLRAREIIMQDNSIPPEDKEGILKLIQVLAEAAAVSPQPRKKGDQIKTFTQAIVSKHSLMTLVKQQAEELDALKNLSLNLTSSLDLQTVLDAVVSEAMRLVKDARTAHIFLFTDGKLEFGAALNYDGMRDQPVSMPRKDGLTYAVASGGKQIVVEDMKQHLLYQSAPSDWYGSIIGIPLKINKKVVGVMNLSRSTVGGFIPAELRLLSLLADQAAVAISNASLHKMVTEQANSDTVTGLPNRRAMDERLEEEVRYARRTNSQFALIMMDLDGFKAVNDTYGHAVGDDVLRSAFTYLARGMRTTDFLARYGGDELTLILHQADLDTARVVTDKILEKTKEYVYNLPGKRKLRISVSGGIAIYPLHSQSGADLLRAADAALYHAKKYNRGAFTIARGFTGPLNTAGTPPAME